MNFPNFKKKHFLITGGAGFIGSNLSLTILNNGGHVVCLDDLSTGSEKNIADFKKNPNYKFIKGNVNDLKDLKRVFAKNQFNYIVHYAARVGVIRTIQRPLEVLEDIQGIRHLLELAKNRDIKKIIFSSSSEVYGEPVEIPEREDGHLDAQLPYAVVKLVGENFMKAYYQTYGLKTCSLRFFNVYGPRQDASAYGFVVGIFIKKALKGEPINIFGDGTQTRDFVFIEDNLNATLCALLSDETDGESINIGSGQPITILDLAETIKRVLKSNSEIKFFPWRKNGEIRHRFPDVEKMKRLLKYTPRNSLEDGIRKTAEWYS